MDSSLTGMIADTNAITYASYVPYTHALAEDNAPTTFVYLQLEYHLSLNLKPAPTSSLFNSILETDT